ncbi:hypothetical protein HS088_TW17G00010 [Tripterygium wilfordii]|uniref:Uncharacterized protein n=1 Tax=Tripterygium wilfordii TaxID=458696 RepID=A0A7J7CEC4_TRIWF|nr:uncharacterized protein LOC119981781 [Tripterygium wilfordii]KAF5732483.1 hypothetical protein HS088_TW17G00010 [Tripterygium wilfordii]
MEDSQLNGIVEKTQDMEPSQNHDKKLSLGDVKEFNSVVDDGMSDAQQVKISEEDKESDEKSHQAEDSVALEAEKEDVKSVVEPLMSLPEAVAKSVEPDATIEVANKGVEDKTLPYPEEKVGKSSIANPDVGMNGIDGTTQAASDEKAKTAPTAADEYGSTPSDIADETPRGIEEKENGESPPKGVREAERTAVVASTGESSAIFDEEAVNNADALLLNQSADIPGVGSADGGDQDDKAKITERSENSPVISLTQRTLRPTSTSWRSCCGLLQVLRRS